MNMGYFLADSGGFPTNCNQFGTDPGCGTSYLGANGEYYAQAANTPNAPSNFSLLSSSIALRITLLGGYASKDVANNNPYAGNYANSFGYYDASQTTAGGAAGTEVPIYASGSIPGSLGNSQSFVPLYANYGFYETVCQSTVLVGSTYQCTATSTYFTNEALNPGAENSHQHFALFSLASNPTMFFIGVEDGLNGDAIEGNGDFNDIMVRLITGAPTTPLPEPATFALIGSGLVGLLFARSRLGNRYSPK
jgi:hypothetical protein